MATNDNEVVKCDNMAARLQRNLWKVTKFIKREVND